VPARAVLRDAAGGKGVRLLRLGLVRVDKSGLLDHDLRMPRPAFVSAVRAVDWRHLRSTYESGEIVRDIVLALASRDETEVRRAWQQIGKTVLRHQGTVYPATAAAAPFLCQIALDEVSLWRAALTAELSYLSTGYDEPYAPAGTARAVRDAVRPYVGEVLGLWESAGPGLGMALVAVSVAFPAEAAVITGQLTTGSADRSRRSAPLWALPSGTTDWPTRPSSRSSWTRWASRSAGPPAPVAWSASFLMTPRSRGQPRNPTLTARCRTRSRGPNACEPERRNRPAISSRSPAS